LFDYQSQKLSQHWFNRFIMHSSTLVSVAGTMMMMATAIAAPSNRAKPSQAPATQLFAFKNSTFLENTSIRSDGKLFLSSLSTSNLMEFDPNTADGVKITATIPEATGLLASTFIDDERLVVHAGQVDMATYSIVKGTAAIWEVNFRRCPPSIRKVASIPETQMLNGMAALPAHPHIILSLDSIGGRVFRTNTRSGSVDVPIHNPTWFGPGPDATIPLGANGIQIRGNTLFFTNSAQAFFAKVKINDRGEPMGEPEKIHQNANATFSTSYDDFDVDSEGNAYICRDPNKLVKVTPDGETSLFVGGSRNPLIYTPTSVRLTSNGKTAFVVTGGADKVVDGEFLGGQIIAVDLD
jgi:hypothetical protein